MRIFRVDLNEGSHSWCSSETFALRVGTVSTKANSTLMIDHVVKIDEMTIAKIDIRRS